MHMLPPHDRRSMAPVEISRKGIRHTWKTGRCVVPSVRHEDIVARVLIAEVDSVKAVEGNIQNAWPEKEMHIRDCGKNQTSRDWVQRTVEGWGGWGPGGCGPGPLLKGRPILSSKLAEWEEIETCCTNFALKAAAESASVSTDIIPTFDMLKMKEIS